MIMRSALSQTNMLSWIYFYSGSSLKQPSVDRHVAPLGHIILIPSQSIFLIPHAQWRNNKYQFLSLWFVSTLIITPPMQFHFLLKCKQQAKTRLNCPIPDSKNADIKFSAHEAFLENHSSGTFNIDILESQIIQKCLGTIKPKGL